MKYVLQDMDATRCNERPMFVAKSKPNGVTQRPSSNATRYTREQAIDIQTRTKGRYRAIPETAPIVEDNS